VCNNLFMPAGSIRARVRAEMTAEIKAVARRHLETEGANLSLRAVARDMGMVSSALYRYFAGRDELLTALILDAYNALGEAVAAADASVADRASLRSRWLAATCAVRLWALANPAEYALIYGSPVPGYAAPADTIIAAARTPAVLAGILADGYDSGALSATGPLAVAASARLTGPIRTELAGARDDLAPQLPAELFLAGLTTWVQVFGLVSFELFGQFNNVIEARDDFFGAQMEMLADLLGLGQEHR
jgi:AcrR family transcriptional regulator